MLSLEKLHILNDLYTCNLKTLYYVSQLKQSYHKFAHPLCGYYQLQEIKNKLGVPSNGTMYIPTSEKIDQIEKGETHIQTAWCIHKPTFHQNMEQQQKIGFTLS